MYLSINTMIEAGIFNRVCRIIKYIIIGQNNKRYQFIMSMNKRCIYLKLVFILLICCICIVSVHSYGCHKYFYNYSLLVLQWNEEYCYHNQNCKPNWRDIFISNQWVIHGYWPASQDLDFINCIQYQGNDPNCNVDFRYNDRIFTPYTRTDLNIYWPEITTSNDIKQDQWYEHGTCYMSVIQTLNPSYIGKEQQIFESYFNSPIRKAIQLKLSLNKTQFKDKNQLAIAIGVKTEEYHALCEYDSDYLSKVMVCYELNPQLGGQRTIKCPTLLPNQCQFPVKARTKFQQQLKILIWLFLVVFVLYF